MPEITSLSALLAHERVATLRAQAGHPLPQDDRSAGPWDPRPRPATVPPSPALLLPLRWIPESA